MVEENDEKIGILTAVAPANGGIIFADEPGKWYNATNTAKNDVKAELKGKKVVIRLADDKRQFSFISLHNDQPEQAASEVDESNIDEVISSVEKLSKDDYWTRKEARDLTLQTQISRHGALNTALESINASIHSGSSGATITAEEILKQAEVLANDHILPFVKK